MRRRQKCHPFRHPSQPRSSTATQPSVYQTSIPPRVA
jgi:hypothetical protein